MKNMLLSLVLLISSCFAIAAKPWEKGDFTKWNVKEAKQILEFSPWVALYEYGDVGTMGKSLTLSSGMANEREYVVIIRIRLFSSPVIRQAFVVNTAKGDAGKLGRMKDFATRTIDDEIIVSWEIDSKPQGISAAYELQQMLPKLSTSLLKADTFLVTSSGTKVFLKDYIPPTSDGTGAKFVFSRLLPDGQPLVKPDDKWLRFQANNFVMQGQTEISDPSVGQRSSEFSVVGRKITNVDATFKLKDMIFNGILVF